MTLTERFWDYVGSERLFERGDHLIVAVSGGVDSIVLCALCHQHKLSFSIAHCNFQLRGEESERDEAFVRELAKKYGVTIDVIRFDTEDYARQHSVSIQVAARELRYAWFEELRVKRLPGRCLIVTAHHADDDVETSLRNYFKGTGIAGLRGMLSRQGFIVRPLLFARKEELLSFAIDNELAWVEDSSNESNKYDRNYIRNQVIPFMEKIVPGAADNVAANLPRFREIEELYQQAIALHRKKLLKQQGDEWRIAILQLQKTKSIRTILYELLKPFGFSSSQVGEVMAIMESRPGAYVQSSTYRVINNRNWLIIAPLVSAEEGLALVEGVGSTVVGRGTLHTSLRRVNDIVLGANKDPFRASVDAAAIKFPLFIRGWKAGDYFYPLGMPKKKKVARFLIDLKLSKTEKERVRVVEMDKKIIWVIGYRIDDRFKVSEQTKQIMTFHYVA